MSERKGREKTNVGARSWAARYAEQSIGRRAEFAELGSNRHSDAPRGRLAKLKAKKLDIGRRRDGSVTHRKSACQMVSDTVASKHVLNLLTVESDLVVSSII